ncbi:hypothetical protein [Nannocystis punicea]|uniref:Uncharacterized protein n=1 Tax=Nannocystis punicea TaxID=2995304 RepID=A0ABY7H0L1_9BACT|nr:hypothetical protein [Nannocystis poenicansa]WAS92786.1 hypothetical protein O0S08_41960 [Nannocystis poenicansa]
MSSALVVLAVVLLVVVPAFVLGLRAALQHQRRYDEGLKNKEQAPRKSRPDPDQELVIAAGRLVKAYVFEPASAVEVTEEMLCEAPEAWHGKTIRVVAWWGIGFEYSSIGPAHAVGVNGIASPGRGRHKVRAAGLWVFPRAQGSSKNLPGFGHLGMSWGEFRIHEAEFLIIQSDDEAASS